jgi:hypothetical protein
MTKTKAAKKHECSFYLLETRIKQKLRVESKLQCSKQARQIITACANCLERTATRQRM